MGTRSLTYVYDEYGEKIINLYRQFDGYPTGHGQELAEFLNSGRMVNGLENDPKERLFNGAGCLAAQLVAHFKNEAGGFYLYSPAVEDCGQDYEYHVYTDGEIRVKIMDCGVNVFGLTQSEIYKPLFQGNLEQFTKYCSSEKYGEVQVNPITNTFENSLIGQEVLKKELANGVVTVVFQKQDGSERVMKATLNEDYVPLLDTTTVKQKKAPNPDVLAVWDTEAKGWRSFRFDSIKSIQYA
jgi:hypothetical protein